MNIFERAARAKLRFDSIRGALTVEDLFDVPLRAKSNFNLDYIARDVNRSLQEVSTESFVDGTAKSTPLRAEAELKLEIVKHVIASKLADEQAAKTRAEKAEKKQKLLEALARKQDESINNLSQEELLKQLEQLDL